MATVDVLLGFENSIGGMFLKSGQRGAVGDNAVCLVQDFDLVGVVLSHGAILSYKATKGAYAVNDKVVIPVKDDFVVGAIVSLEDGASANLNVGYRYRWVACKVDLAEFWRLEEVEAQAAGVLRQRMAERRQKENQARLREAIGEEALEAARAAMGAKGLGE